MWIAFGIYPSPSSDKRGTPRTTVSVSRTLLRFFSPHGVPFPELLAIGFAHGTIGGQEPWGPGSVRDFPGQHELSIRLASVHPLEPFSDVARDVQHQNGVSIRIFSRAEGSVSEP